jgi:hypothetical protein
MEAFISSWQHADTQAWSSQQPIPIDHPLVPYAVRTAVSGTASTNRLYRVVSSSMVEWWLMDINGELLNIFWQAGQLNERVKSQGYIARGTIYE